MRETEDGEPHETSTARQLAAKINAEHFQSWYQERRLRENIEKGKGHHNKPHSVSPPERHTPSRLLQCHRRVYYQHSNAPAEKKQPRGIFWFGSQYETDIVFPFLRAIIGPEQYVRKSVWVDFIISGTDEEVRFRGGTDPVIVDAESTSLLLTEIKTTSSFTNLDSPQPHHLAQVHAYMYGLSQEGDSVEDAVIIYGKRDDLSLRSFHITFDTRFWREKVLSWASTNTKYRRSENLPPADPEFNWECRFCAYRRRCGQTDEPHDDSPATGFLPLTSYPRARIEEHLGTYSELQLTPTLSHYYPNLAEEYGSYDWRCPVCGCKYSVNEIEWNGDLERPPLCSACGENGTIAPLAGPSPTSQTEQGDG